MYIYIYIYYISIYIYIYMYVCHIVIYVTLKGRNKVALRRCDIVDHPPSHRRGTLKGVPTVKSPTSHL